MKKLSNTDAELKKNMSRCVRGYKKGRIKKETVSGGLKKKHWGDMD